ncbi:MAG: CDP-alcohol phosphatidyltransferase family protein [Micromonosporaceae bacterium]|nr:CDP-alcohol phosphatidyltransferase family protein [Micromonosporaceae bacterium]
MTVTRAVLVAGAGLAPGSSTAALAPLDGGTVVTRLRDQLGALGVTDLVVLARPADAETLRSHGLTVRECADLAADLAAVAALAEPGGPLLLCAADLVTSPTSLGAVIAAGGPRCVALTMRPPADDALSGAPLPTAASVRGRLTSVGLGESDQPARKVFGGVLAGPATEIRAAAEAVAKEVVDNGAQVGGPAGREVPRGSPGAGDVLRLILRQLVVAGPVVFAQRTRGLPSWRVADAASAAAAAGALREIDEHAARLRLAVKRRDDFFTTYFVSPFSPRLVRWAARAGLAPTTVTWMSVAVATVAALAFAQGARPWLVAGAALLYVSFVLDCVDGQLARYLQRYSRFGGWLDALCDRGKEYLVYAGLAVGASRAGLGDVWPLALAAMVLLTARHMTDTWYGAVQDQAVERLAHQPASSPDARPEPAAAASSEPVTAPRRGARLGAALAAASRRLQGRRAGPAYWLKRTIPLPIGERWMLIALAAAFFDARVALLALLGWGGFAAAYTLFGRTLQTQHLRVPVMAVADRNLYRDDGVIAGALGRLWPGRVAPLPLSALPALVVALGVALLLFGVPVTPGQVAVAGAAAAGVAGLASGQPHDGPLDWLVPAALRISEYAVVVLLGHHAGVPTPVVYGLLAVVVLSHYDLTARLERAGSPVLWRGLLLGWDGRIAVLGAAVLLGAATPVFAALAVAFGLFFLVSGTLGAALAGRKPTASPSNAEPRLPARAE